MRYVINMLAKPEKIQVSQLKKDISSVDEGMRLYLENSYVCLYSVKHHNPDINCVLFVSFDIGEEWKTRFNKAGIDIIQIEFGGYKIGSEFNWGIVQFRYDVIKYICESYDDNDSVIMLDTDIVCTDSLERAFEEIDGRVCLYDVQHAIDHVDRKNINDNCKLLYPDSVDKNVIHYGGEFIGSKVHRLRVIFEESVDIMKKSEEISGLKNFNDEHITSIAVDNLRDKIYVNNANAYIARYWTSKGFYLASTNHTFNSVALWHMPLEKNRGLLYLYSIISKTGKMPERKKLIAMFGLPEAKRSHKLLNYRIQIWLKLFRK